MQDEFSLKDILKILLRGKRILLIVTIAAMVLTGLINYLLLKPTYVVTSIVTIIDQPQLGDKQLPQIKNLSAFAEQIKSDITVDKVINTLKLDRKIYSLKSIQQSLTVTPENDQNLMKIQIKGKDPELITKIADSFVYELGAKVEIANATIANVQLSLEKKQVIDQINITQSEIQQASDILIDTPEKIKTSKSLSESPYLMSIINDNIKASNKDLQLTSEEINEVYIALKNKLAESKINLSKLQAEKGNLETKQADNDKIIGDLTNKSLDISTPEASNTLFKSIIITPAISPIDPIGPRKLMNVAIIGFISVVLMSFALIFKEYWRGNGSITRPE